MRERVRCGVALALCLLVLESSRAAVQAATEYGPPNGTLLVVGGGRLDDTGIYEKFIELAGGPDAKFIIVPTASGNRGQDGSIRQYKEEDVVASWLRRGLKNVRMLHTYDPKVADAEEFVRHLREANAVWFNAFREADPEQLGLLLDDRDQIVPAIRRRPSCGGTGRPAAIFRGASVRSRGRAV